MYMYREREVERRARKCFCCICSLTGRDIRTWHTDKCTNVLIYYLFVQCAHVNTCMWVALLFGEKPSDCQWMNVKQLCMLTMVFWPGFITSLYPIHRTCKLILWQINAYKSWCAVWFSCDNRNINNWITFSMKWEYGWTGQLQIHVDVHLLSAVFTFTCNCHVFHSM